uniref:Transposase Tc1-like domain-containing protein n=1 Tax=Oryzias latipes TaxID=8090 RepID=A0A3P9L3D3_ORYLA
MRSPKLPKKKKKEFGKPSKGYKPISKQLEVPVTTVAHIIQKFKTHGTWTGRRPRRTRLLKGNHKKARLDLQKCMLTSHKASGKMSFGQMRQNWIFLVRHISSVFVDSKMKHPTKRTLSLL